MYRLREPRYKPLGHWSWKTNVHDIRCNSLECAICDVLIKGVVHFVQPLDERTPLHLFLRPGSSLKVVYSAFTSRSWYLEFYVEEHHPRLLPFFGHARTLQGSATRSTQIVFGWLHACLQTHQMCKVQGRNLPTRVIHVGSESHEPRLYETHNEEAAYTALSHCWGQNQGTQLVTTRGSLQDRMKYIPMKSLPQTFRDAVLLTRNLNVEYIWIDSLCIIQDDEDDWAKESARMAEVYQNARLTISADGAANGSEGLFATSMEHCCKEIIIPLKQKGGLNHVHVRETSLQGNGDCVHVISSANSNPLRRRGWALQEWLLSTRIVHFMRGEVLWECEHSQVCECQVTSQMPAKLEELQQEGVYRSHARANFFGRSVYAQSRRNLNWALVVFEYTRRQLTRESDRLPALSGLAAFHRANTGAEYAAGLWKSELPGALLWVVDSDEKSRRHCTYQAPTWSWASVQGRVGLWPYSCDGNHASKCEILELSVTPASDNIFGALEHGFLRIKGVVGTLSRNFELRGGTLFYIEGKGDDYDYYGEIHHDIKDCALEMTSADEVSFLIVYRWIGDGHVIHGIALKPCEGRNGTFTRIGYIHMYYKGGDWESWSRNTLRASEQIITIV